MEFKKLLDTIVAKSKAGKLKTWLESLSPEEAIEAHQMIAKFQMVWGITNNDAEVIKNAKSLGKEVKKLDDMNAELKVKNMLNEVEQVRSSKYQTYEDYRTGLIDHILDNPDDEEIKAYARGAIMKEREENTYDHNNWKEVYDLLK